MMRRRRPPTARRSASAFAVTASPSSGISRERSADRSSADGSCPSCSRASFTVSAVVHTSRSAPLMVRLSRRPRSRAICEPSSIWVPAAGARMSWSPACSPAEDSAPSTEPARVVTWRCSPSTVMVTLFAREAAVPPPTASRPMVAAAATRTTLRRNPVRPVRVTWLLSTAVLSVLSVLSAWSAVDAAEINSSDVGSCSPSTLSGCSFTSHPMDLVGSRAGGIGAAARCEMVVLNHIGKAT